MSREISNGPVSSMPGSSHSHSLDDDDFCDCGAKATKKIQGETDSFGCEYAFFCDPCFKEYKQQLAEAAEQIWPCDWCKKEAKLFSKRDIDEGLHGPVYQVCKECRDKYDKRLAEEMDEYYDPRFDD